MPKPTSKSTLSLITKKLSTEREMIGPRPIWADKSPEHPRSPSTASEKESATTEQNQKTDADEVSRELDMEAEEDEETEVSTEEESEPSDSEKVTESAKTDKETTKETRKVPEATDPIPLDDILKEADVSIKEQKIIMEDLSIWWPKDLVNPAPADIITEPQYCSRDTRQALYTITSQLSEQGHSRRTWDPSWDIHALMTSGMYHSTFQALWQMRAKTKSLKSPVPKTNSQSPRRRSTFR